MNLEVDVLAKYVERSLVSSKAVLEDEVAALRARVEALEKALAAR